MTSPDDHPNLEDYIDDVVEQRFEEMREDFEKSLGPSRPLLLEGYGVVNPPQFEEDEEPAC